jgi:protein-disulfide isomerase
MRRAALMAALAILAAAQPGFAQSSEDLQNLRKEIEALKEGQKTIQSDLQEIKNLLRARPTAAAPPTQEAVVSVDGAPFKGSKTAKVTLVEFTDYQ